VDLTALRGGSEQIHRSVQVAEGSPLEQGIVDVERVLRREHRIPLGGDLFYCRARINDESTGPDTLRRRP